MAALQISVFSVKIMSSSTGWSEMFSDAAGMSLFSEKEAVQVVCQHLS
jgi:hypothetical protein